MLTAWRELCLRVAKQPADFYSGCRKIIRNFEWKAPTSALNHKDGRMEDFGFTKSKMTMLTKLYYNVESVGVASQLWEKRVAQDKYGSVGWSFYNHLVKGGMEKRSKRASVMGPCLQAGVITYLDRDTFDLDIFYRTTEVLKKFPADLVFLRDVVVPNLGLDMDSVESMRFHFVNLTVHPMYFVTLIPHLEDPLSELRELKIKDPHFWKWVVKWTGRYLCDEHGNGIQKFAQAMRTADAARSLIPKKTQKELAAYIRKNWPGVKHRETDESEDE